MRKQSIIKQFCLWISLILVISVCGFSVEAEEREINEETGYERILDDEADLLTEEEEEQLFQDMEPITVYGNVAFKSIDRNTTTTKQYAERYYREQFSNKSGTLFLIDMDERNIWIFSDGELYKTITKNNADTITDNVYRYASDEEYYECASKAFEQMTKLLSGQKIARPMKYICNYLLALLMALIICYLVVRNYARMHAPSRNEMLGAIYAKCELHNPSTYMYKQDKIYHKPSSSGGHGGGGGGGHSGGGGGHGF